MITAIPQGNDCRFRIRFYGRVQGVGFRYAAYHIAQALSLTGWVENEFDGTVLCEVQGKSTAVDEFLGRLNDSRYIRIDDMDIKKLALDESERCFDIRG